MSELNNPTFYDRYFAWILIVFLISIYPVDYGCRKSEETNNNNIKQWLPENENFAEKTIYDDFVDHFGTDEYAIVRWRGCTLTDPRLAKFASLVRDYKNDQGEKLYAKITILSA